MSFQTNIQLFQKLSNGPPKKKMVWWRDLLSKAPAALPFLLTLATFYFGVVQFFYSQNLIDRRKYVNSYYDERFKVLKDVATSTVKIYATLTQDTIVRSTSRDTINKYLPTLYYAYLVLDEGTSDSAVLINIENYLENVNDILIDGFRKTSPVDLYDLNIKILQQAGNIFANEKDTINSFNFKFFPFGENKRPG